MLRLSFTRIRAPSPSENTSIAQILEGEGASMSVDDTNIQLVSGRVDKSDRSVSGYAK